MLQPSVFAQTVPLCPKCAPTGVVEDKGSPPKKKSRLMDGQANDESDTEDWRSEWYNKPILKPDITFFGQPLDDAFDKCLIEDREEADLLIIIGTSLQVSLYFPAATELLRFFDCRLPLFPSFFRTYPTAYRRSSSTAIQCLTSWTG